MKRIPIITFLKNLLKIKTKKMGRERGEKKKRRRYNDSLYLNNLKALRAGEERTLLLPASTDVMYMNDVGL